MTILKYAFLAAISAPALLATGSPALGQTADPQPAGQAEATLPSEQQLLRWHRRVMDELSLAPALIEYGCTNRSEIILAHLTQWGVPKSALGRVSTYYDAGKSPDGDDTTFRLNDPLHGAEFQQAWQAHYGGLPKRIFLTDGESPLTLDVSGTIRWNVGHIAPTITIRDAGGNRQIYVIDPALAPQAPIRIAAWRRAQNAEKAAIVWGGLGAAPRILPAYLSPEQQMKLAAWLNVPSTNPPELSRALERLPEVQRQIIQARLLNIADDAPWHPRHWRGYSFAGGLKDEAGRTLPDWDEAGSTDASARLARTQALMAPLFTYEAARNRHKTPAEFLQESTKLNTEKQVIIKIQPR